MLGLTDSLTPTPATKCKDLHWVIPVEIFPLHSQVHQPGFKATGLVMDWVLLLLPILAPVSQLSLPSLASVWHPWMSSHSLSHLCWLLEPGKAKISWAKTPDYIEHSCTLSTYLDYHRTHCYNTFPSRLLLRHSKPVARRYKCYGTLHQWDKENLILLASSQ